MFTSLKKMWMNVTFDQFCCSTEKIRNNKDIDSITKLLQATESCFDVNSTLQLDVIVSLYDVNITQPFREVDCHKHPCNAPPTANNLVYILWWVCLFMLIVSSNSVVIVAVNKVSSLKRNVANIFITSLAMSDLLVGVFIIPMKIKNAYNNHLFCSSLDLCRIYMTADAVFFTVSITNLLVISVERYMAICFPYHHERIVAPRRSKVAVVCIWFYGALWGVMSNINWGDTYHSAFFVKNHQCLRNSTEYLFMYLNFTLVFYIPAIVMGVLYYQLMALTQSHARSISYSASLHKKAKAARLIDQHRNNNNHLPKILRNQQYRRSVLKAAKTIAIVYGTFVVCWLPLSIIVIVHSVCKQCFKQDLSSTKWVYVVFVEVLPILNSTANPFIYAITNKKYRKALRKLFEMALRKDSTDHSSKKRANTFQSTLIQDQLLHSERIELH